MRLWRGVELIVRRAIHAAGLRFRLHVRDLPGTPDIVLPRYKAVIFVNGCFWHGHDCHLFKVPSTRTEFWMEKISANRLRDRSVCAALCARGWRVLTIWECALRGPLRLPYDAIAELTTKYLHTSEEYGTIDFSGYHSADDFG